METNTQYALIVPYKNMSKITYTLLSILIFISCKNYDANIYNTGKDVSIPSPIHITVEELISEYDTIRLESSEHSLLSGILQIHIMNDKLYITESNQSMVFIYSMHGKYLSKICNQGEGPEEYIRIGSFETDPANDRLLISDSFSKRLFEYNEDGVLLRVMPLSFTPQRIVSDTSKRYIHLNSTTTAEYNLPEMKENNVHIINNDGKVTDTFLKDNTPEQLNILSACATSYAENGELLYMPILSNTIYRIHNQEAIPEYTLNNQSGRKTMSTEEKAKLYYRYEQNNIEDAEEEGYLINCGSFLASDSILFLDLGWNKPLYTYYSKQNEQAISIHPDKLKGNQGLCEVFSAHPKAILGNSLYISVAPEKIQYVRPLLPEGKLKTFFETMTEEDNPCILKYRLNKRLLTGN